MELVMGLSMVAMMESALVVWWDGSMVAKMDALMAKVMVVQSDEAMVTKLVEMLDSGTDACWVVLWAGLLADLWAVGKAAMKDHATAGKRVGKKVGWTDAGSDAQMANMLADSMVG